MKNAIIRTETDELNAIKKLVTDSLTSELSRTMYDKAITDFLMWYVQQGKPGLTKATVQAYKIHLQSLNLAPSTINQKLSAIRKLATEAADNNLIDQAIASGISHVRGIKSSGVRTGNWLTLEQVQQLISTPDTTTLKGLRDRAILVLMVGSGLRRSEVAALTFEHIQQRDGRWVICDMLGKGNRVRTVPIPSWSKQAIDEWAQASGISSGRVFRSINKGDNITGDTMTSQAIQDVVKHYAGVCGFEIAAHDLRRTFAKLARRGGADLSQIQLTLGHASIQTTERYLGELQDLTTAPCDVIRLHLRYR